MSLFFLNKTFLEEMNKHRRQFFWHGKKLNKGYYMVKWCKVCPSKNKGGLGVLDLRKQNISLLLTRTRPIGSSLLAYPLLAKEEAHSKDA
jgi:hypothetical protein